MTPNRDVLIRQAERPAVEIDMSAFEESLLERICHWYPHDPRYRLSGQNKPQPGDIAYCGHVKDIPFSGGSSLAWPQCPQCMRLKRMDGYA